MYSIYKALVCYIKYYVVVCWSIMHTTAVLQFPARVPMPVMYGYKQICSAKITRLMFSLWKFQQMWRKVTIRTHVSSSHLIWLVNNPILIHVHVSSILFFVPAGYFHCLMLTSVMDRQFCTFSTLTTYLFLNTAYISSLCQWYSSKFQLFVKLRKLHECKFL